MDNYLKLKNYIKHHQVNHFYLEIKHIDLFLMHNKQILNHNLKN